MGSILAPFRPSGPLCFPVRQRAFSASGGRAAAATGAAGGFYVSLCLIVQTAVQKIVENYCFARVSEGTLGSFWARFWRCSVLQGHVRQGAFSASGGRAAAATGAAGGFYVSLCLIVQTAVQKMVENYCFSRVSEGTLGSFWVRFWRCSVLQGHCVSLSGRVRFQLREEEQQQQQAGGFYVSLCLIVQTAVQKMVENYCFSRGSEGTLGSFWARCWRCSVLQGHCVSLSGSVRFQLREEEQQQQQEQQEGSMSHYVSLYKQRYKK